MMAVKGSVTQISDEVSSSYRNLPLRSDEARRKIIPCLNTESTRYGRGLAGFELIEKIVRVGTSLFYAYSICIYVINAVLMCMYVYVW